MHMSTKQQSKAPFRLERGARLHTEVVRESWSNCSPPVYVLVPHEVFKSNLSRHLHKNEKFGIRVQVPGKEDRRPLHATYELIAEPGADGKPLGRLDVTKVHEYVLKTKSYSAVVEANDHLEVYSSDKVDCFVLALIKQKCAVCCAETTGTHSCTCEVCHRLFHHSCAGLSRSRGAQSFRCAECRKHEAVSQPSQQQPSQQHSSQQQHTTQHLDAGEVSVPKRFPRRRQQLSARRRQGAARPEEGSAGNEGCEAAAGGAAAAGDGAHDFATHGGGSGSAGGRSVRGARSGSAEHVSKRRRVDEPGGPIGTTFSVGDGDAGRKGGSVSAPDGAEGGLQSPCEAVSGRAVTADGGEEEMEAGGEGHAGLITAVAGGSAAAGALARPDGDGDGPHPSAGRSDVRPSRRKQQQQSPARGCGGGRPQHARTAAAAVTPKRREGRRRGRGRGPDSAAVAGGIDDVRDESQNLSGRSGRGGGSSGASDSMPGAADEGNVHIATWQSAGADEDEAPAATAPLGVIQAASAAAAALLAATKVATVATAQVTGAEAAGEPVQVAAASEGLDALDAAEAPEAAELAGAVVAVEMMPANHVVRHGERGFGMHDSAAGGAATDAVDAGPPAADSLEAVTSVDATAGDGGPLVGGALQEVLPRGAHPEQSTAPGRVGATPPEAGASVGPSAAAGPNFQESGGAGAGPSGHCASRGILQAALARAHRAPPPSPEAANPSFGPALQTADAVTVVPAVAPQGGVAAPPVHALTGGRAGADAAAPTETSGHGGGNVNIAAAAAGDDSDEDGSSDDGAVPGAVPGAVAPVRRGSSGGGAADDSDPHLEALLREFPVPHYSAELPAAAAPPSSCRVPTGLVASIPDSLRSAYESIMQSLDRGDTGEAACAHKLRQAGACWQRLVELYGQQKTRLGRRCADMQRQQERQARQLEQSRLQLKRQAQEIMALQAAAAAMAQANTRSQQEEARQRELVSELRLRLRTAADDKAALEAQAVAAEREAAQLQAALLEAQQELQQIREDAQRQRRELQQAEELRRGHAEEWEDARRGLQLQLQEQTEVAEARRRELQALAEEAGARQRELQTQAEDGTRWQAQQLHQLQQQLDDAQRRHEQEVAALRGQIAMTLQGASGSRVGGGVGGGGLADGMVYGAVHAHGHRGDAALDPAGEASRAYVEQLEATVSRLRGDVMHQMAERAAERAALEAETERWRLIARRAPPRATEYQPHHPQHQPSAPLPQQQHQRQQSHAYAAHIVPPAGTEVDAPLVGPGQGYGPGRQNLYGAPGLVNGTATESNGPGSSGASLPPLYYQQQQQPVLHPHPHHQVQIFPQYPSSAAPYQYQVTYSSQPAAQQPPLQQPPQQQQLHMQQPQQHMPQPHPPQPQPLLSGSYLQQHSPSQQQPQQQQPSPHPQQQQQPQPLPQPQEPDQHSPQHVHNPSQPLLGAA